MKGMNTYKTACLLAVLVVSISSLVTPVKAADRIPGSGVFSHVVGRAVITNSGDLEIIGYYAFLEGIPGPFFVGAPGEATAFFTFRSGPLSFSDGFVNGSIVWAVGGSAKLTVYLNVSPHGNWNDPDSFSSGRPIATFHRSVGLVNCNGNLNLLNTCGFTISDALVSGEDFTFNGGTFNFTKLIPYGVTEVGTMLDLSFPGFAGVFVGYDLAIGRGDEARR